MSNSVENILLKLKNNPDEIDFKKVIGAIADDYEYFPTQFENGGMMNASGVNEGSCKIFYFAKLQQLNVEDTLALFGVYYRDEVLKDADGSSHANIRSFMRHGWGELNFFGAALVARTETAR
ncbi:MAG: hypothetical protein ACI93R_000020 [Flavobacteriales bacterium]|jgi:hypothetical protein